MRYIVVAFAMVLVAGACENRALHDSEEFKPREIHENIEFHFDPIEVDGVEYLILEKDNNNPHEGFGFMAFRANRLIEKQDSVIAYLRTILEMQEMIYAKSYNIDTAAARRLSGAILQKNIDAQLSEIRRLEERDLSGTTAAEEEEQ